MSKEMVNSRLRLKKLKYIVEDDVTYILVADKPTDATHSDKVAQKKVVVAKPRTTVATVIALYQRENAQLKDKITQLESKIDKLIDDKEQMLRGERDKIEELYNKKDEQLKNILELINTKMLLENQNHTIHEVETLDKKESKLSIIELKQYLKTLDIDSYQKKVIKRRFLATYDTDDRIAQKNGKLYLDFSRYDYSDLLS